MQKRGVSNQVFIYIFVIIVAGLVFLFGFQQISRLVSLNEKAIYVEFQSGFKNAVNGVYNKNEGSKITYSIESSNKPLRLPKGIERIYFEEENGKIKVIPSDANYNSFTVDNLKTNVQSIKANGQISFVLENVIEQGETKVLLKNA